MNRDLPHRPLFTHLVLWALVAVVGVPAHSAAGEPAPTTSRAERSAALVATLTPAELERAFSERPQQALEVLLQLGAGLAEAPPALVPRLQDFLAATARERGRQLSDRGPPWTGAEVETLLVLLVVDPPRFADDDGFRERVIPVIERGLDPRTAAELRDRLLYGLNRMRNFHFRYAERVALAWGAIRRSSQSFRIPFDPVAGLARETPDRPILASVYSLPSYFFAADDAAALLREVHRVAPHRRLLVLCDAPMRTALQPLTAELPLTLLETYGRPFSPWIRDVLSFRRRMDGRVVLVLRPDTQLGREDDAHMGQVLLQQLPGDLLESWMPAWTASTIPFHNGQILETGDSAWISVHSLKTHIRRLTGIERAPRADAQGSATYLSSARQAAGQLERLLAKPARFVHPLDAPGAAAPGLGRLLRGASFDLDSLLTLLPGEPLRGLVGDLAAGRGLVEALDRSDLDELRRAFGLRHRDGELRRELAAAQEDPAATELQAFVDSIAEHLAAEGVPVRRLPLLRIPDRLLTQPRVRRDFLLGWNNVTLEKTGEGWTAEGFASPLARGNEIAVEVFKEAGYRLHLLPPLVESIARNGGYRCASNHLRFAHTR